ncbi:MAG: hypothetical protein BalsKO_29020 [Balneolaceae bacterium]
MPISSYGQSTVSGESKEISVERNLNLEVLFTIYSQIWTPFLYDGVTESMLANTQLMELNYNHFKKFKDHEVINTAREFMNRSGTDLFLYAFYYEDFPGTKRIREIPKILTEYINPDRSLALEEIDSLMILVADFYEKSDFNAFYNEYDYVYKMSKEEVVKNLPNQEFIPFLERYFGDSYESYAFYVLPFFKAEFGMAFQLETENGTKNFTFIAPFEPAELEEKSIQYVGYDSKEDIIEWVVHEYSHTFFYPSLSKQENLDALNEFEYLFKPIESSPQVGDWFSMFGEHISVAFEVRAAELLGEKERRIALLEKHKDWHYLDHFINQLKYFESNRDIYPTIGDFMPILIASNEELK